jgi:hypothetical protein
MEATDSAGGAMSDQSPDEHAADPRPHGRPPLADSIRAKLDEYEVERHLSDIAQTVESAVHHGMAKAGDLVHEHRGDIDRLLDKAAGVVDRHTDGRHADKITQVRGSLERGVDRIAEQREGE